jgi:outer membrane autotransporter protein
MLSNGIDVKQGGTVSPHLEGNQYGLQLGQPLYSSQNWCAGVYAGLLRADADVRGFASGIENKNTGRLNQVSQYAGMYSKYSTEQGIYIDTALQWGVHNTSVRSKSGRGQSLTTSIETGKFYSVGENGWHVKPHAQLINQAMKLNNSRLSEGTMVHLKADTIWTGRAGVELESPRNKNFQYYGRLGVSDTFGGQDTARFKSSVSTDIDTPLDGTTADLSAGFSVKVSDSARLYGTFGRTFSLGGASRDNSPYSINVGILAPW